MRLLTYKKTQRRRVKNAARHAGNAERVSMPITKGDTVRIVRGDEKGKEGKVLRVLPKKGRVVVEGINIVKRHRKPRSADEPGGIIDFPAPIHHSNVMLLDPKSGEPTRVRVRVAEDGSKERLSAKSGDAIPRKR